MDDNEKGKKETSKVIDINALLKDRARFRDQDRAFNSGDIEEKERIAFEALSETMDRLAQADIKEFQRVIVRYVEALFTLALKHSHGSGPEPGLR